MAFDPDEHHRRSIRLRGYDYSGPGAYFVTICTERRRCLFGDIADGEMRLNEYGRLVSECWHDLPRHYGCVQSDAFVVMPNHVHGIVMLTDDRDPEVRSGSQPTSLTHTLTTDPGVGAGLQPARPRPAPRKRHGLPEIVRGFKTFSSRRINEARNTQGTRLWQRSYYERVVRNEDELQRIREYIVHNPLGWATDEDNPANLKAAVRPTSGR